jgi:hypothetical protein
MMMSRTKVLGLTGAALLIASPVAAQTGAAVGTAANAGGAGSFNRGAAPAMGGMPATGSAATAPMTAGSPQSLSTGVGAAGGRQTMTGGTPGGMPGRN